MLFMPECISHIVVYTEPINLRWGPDRIRRFCADEIGIQPDVFTAFIFANRKQDTLLMYYVDHDGDAIMHKKLPKGAFLMPVPEPARKWIKMRAAMVDRLFRV